MAETNYERYLFEVLFESFTFCRMGFACRIHGENPKTNSMVVFS